MQQRRKSVFGAAPLAVREAAMGAGVAARKNGAPLSLAVVVLSVFLVAAFLYHEDVRPAADDFPSDERVRESSTGYARPLQEAQLAAAHRAVNARGRSTSAAKEEAEAVVRLLDAPVSTEPEKSKKTVVTGQVVKINAKEEAEQDEDKDTDTDAPPPSSEAAPAANQRQEVVRLAEGCDMYRGEWVYDEAKAPLYREASCEFLTEQVTCMRNGRRDDSHQKWRWQPSGCDLPPFDARLLLERLRNKRMMFVGDSLNRNQWESMVCLVQSVIPAGRKSLTKFLNDGPLNVFYAHEYNATVEFYWAPFLVESNSDDPKVHSVRDRVIMWRSIAKHAKNWKGAHYLVFNTYIWWLNTFTMKVLKGSFARGSTRYMEVDRPVAYKEVLKTWAKWVDRHVDPKKTMVFFMGMSPNHITPWAWGNDGGVKCAMETTPITTRPASLDIGTDWRLYFAAQEVMHSYFRRVPVHFVDITALSELRKDAHTSVHTLRQGKLLTPEQQADPQAYADCIHWCLPGLPDTWNHFLFARIASSPWTR